MAGLGWKTWIDGERVDADDFQGYIQNQVIAWFASTSARDAAITSPAEGMVAGITGDNEVTIYTGSAWEKLFSYGGTHTWTPALGATGGSPTIGGGGTSVGRYVYLPDKRISYELHITFGTAPSWGTGTLNVSLPVAPAVTGICVGTARLVDTGTLNYTRTCLYDGSSVLVFVEDNGGGVGGTTPFTVAVGDSIFATGTYRY